MTRCQRTGLPYSVFFLFLGYQSLDVVAEDADALDILTSLRDDEVSIAFGWFDKLLVHGLEDFEIPIHDHGHRTSAVDGVALDVADEALVGVAVYKDF